MPDTGLFGLINSNRSIDGHWGKNCFNSSFPTSMACYMMTHNIPAVYVHVNENLEVIAETIPIREVFNCGDRPLEDLFFSFESIYQPYQEFCLDYIDGIDLVVKDVQGNFLQPLEVKLTVLPNDGTSGKPEEEWGCELVIRSATTSYCALGMFNSIKENARHIRDIFEGPCSSIESWVNDFEMTHKTPLLYESINQFQKEYFNFQKPLLMQTVWKTQGKSPELAENAFDIVIWSDYAFSRLFVDDAIKPTQKMSRPQRATARLARCLWELSKSGRIRVEEIYRSMGFDKQTDKEFAITGTKWKKYVQSERTITPILPKTAVNEIITPGYIQKLSPERRFDQTLFFTVRQEEE